MSDIDRVWRGERPEDRIVALQPMPDGPGAVYARLAQALTAAIDAGAFGQGDQFPSAVMLGHWYQVSRATARTALSRLETAGLVRRVHGGHVYVTGQRSGSS